MTTLNADLALPVLERSRPAFANGPRRLDALRMLRISVTDRCNLRCTYCMPAEGLPFEPCSSYLQPEQIESVARVAHALGVTHVKVTGGEPTVRRELVEIVERLASIGFEDVSLTTNALQLVRLAEPLRDAGINRLTISLDSLQPQRYRDITGGGRLELVHAGIDAARRAGFDRLKINMVVMRGVNDDEIEDFAELAVRNPWTVRFIEFMPLGESRFDADGSDGSVLLANEEVRWRVESTTGPLEPLQRSKEPGVGPAEVFTAKGLTGRIGFISAMSHPFCEQCNRLRLTAAGELRACLFDGGERDLRPLLEPRVDRAGLHRAFEDTVALKPVTHGARGTRQMSQLGG